MNFVFKIHAFVKDMAVYFFVPFMTIVSFVVVIPVVLVMVPFFGPMGSPFSDEPLWVVVIFVCLLAPFFETAVFQSLPIHLLLRLKKLPRLWIVAASAALFGGLHCYDITYIIATFFIGIILAWAYLIYLPKPQGAFMVVSAIHMLRNVVTAIAQFGINGAS